MRYSMVFPRMAILRRNIMDLANQHLSCEKTRMGQPDANQGLEIFGSL